MFRSIQSLTTGRLFGKYWCIRVIGLNKKLKNGLIATSAVLGTTFAVMSYIAKKQRDNDKYKNDSSEQNPMYKKNLTASENKDSNLHSLSQKERLFRYKVSTPFTVQKTGL